MSDFKKLVEARMAKTGESWSTAAHYVRTQAPTQAEGLTPEAVVNDGPPPVLTLELLLKELRAPSTFSVLTGRVPAVGRSGSFQAAVAQSERLAANPLYYAETGVVKTTVSLALHEELLRQGAADDRQIQMIRTHMENDTTFSKACRNCRRWVWCAETEREAACVCGQRYRVVFDLAEVYHWTMRRGWLCTDCGSESRLTERHEGRNPWHFVDQWQTQCNACHLKAQVVDAANKHGELSNQVLRTSPVLGDPSPTDPKLLDEYANADRRYRDAIQAEEQSLRGKFLGTDND